jgi:hypothetical protein
VRSAAPTVWVPRSKPIWFTELGCPAVDKGANQPNVFPDPKSAENARPYFSTGAPDALAQRQFLRAHLNWWRPEADGFEEARNPASDIYAGRMVDPHRLYLWTWDARPYPAFPLDLADWADGGNYAAGHWLTGRLGAVASDEVVAAIATDFGVTIAAADAAPPLLFGLSVDGPGSARDALQPLLDATGLAVHDSPQGLCFARPKPRLATAVAADSLVATDRPLAARKRPDPAEALGRLALGYADRERDYLAGTVTAARLAAGAGRGTTMPLVLDLAGARGVAERLLTEDPASRETLEVALPPSQAALEPGDVVSLAGQGDGPFVLTALRDGDSRRASLVALPPAAPAAIVADRPLPVTATTSTRAIPVAAVAHLPADPDAPGGSRLVLAATSTPWPGEVTVTEDASGAELAALTRRAGLGILAAPLGPGPLAVWDDASVLRVTLYCGHLAAAEEPAVLAGANRIAVETGGGSWEIIGFANATLTAPSTYELRHLLRGQGGTGAAMGAAAAGNRVMVLDGAVATDPVPIDWLGTTLALHVFGGRTDPTGTPLTAAIGLAPALPLAPVHLAARRDPASGDVALSWVRCSRGDTGSWTATEVPLDATPEAYAVTILAGPTPVRTISAQAPSAVYAAADQIADFGSLPAAFTFTVAQLSPTLGPGLGAEGAFSG